jgi:transposase-like protein
MLPGEACLPEAIFALNGQTVNRLFDTLCQDSDHRLNIQFAELFKALQIQWFAGHRSVCPRCNNMHVTRKGWRQRLLKSSRGQLVFVVLQARCKVCGRTFRPFTSRSGIPTSRRFLEELLIKATDLAVQMPFARSSRILKILTGGSISHEGIRQKVAQEAEKITLPTQNVGQTVLVDATKVKAGTKQRGAPVHLAIAVEPGPTVAGRKTITKRLLHLHVGNVGPLRQRLKDLRPQYLVHDGGESYSDCAENVQRCRWHLVHQLKHYLWQDGLAFEERGFYQDCLYSVLWDNKSGRERLNLFIEDMKKFNFPTTAYHLQEARNETFTWTQNPGFTYMTTSPLEREMRELNRRADVGARWSPKGIENVLKLLFHKRLNSEPDGSLCSG